MRSTQPMRFLGTTWSSEAIETVGFLGLRTFASFTSRAGCWSIAKAGTQQETTYTGKRRNHRLVSLTRAFLSTDQGAIAVFVAAVFLAFAVDREASCRGRGWVAWNSKLRIESCHESRRAMVVTGLHK